MSPIVQELGDTRRSRFASVVVSGLWFLFALLGWLLMVCGVILLGGCNA